MIKALRSRLGRWIGILALSAATAQPAMALINLDRGRDKISVGASYGIVYDSNMFAQANGAGDYSQSLSFDAEYARRAGIIGLDASLSVSSALYRKFSNQDFTDPSFKLTLSKDKGRLTGSLGVSAQRSSQSDILANVRTTSWNYGSTLNLSYPINSKYHITNAAGFTRQDYIGANKDGLYNLSSFTESLDAFYSYDAKTDFFAGIDSALGQAREGSNTTDLGFNVGAAGRILSKLKGHVSAGYDGRNESGSKGGKYGSFTVDTSLDWSLRKTVNINAQASRKFTTTATDISTNTTALALSANVKPVNSRFSLEAGVEYSIVDFLGSKGDKREDTNLSLRTGLSFSLGSHLSSLISYSHSINNSNQKIANFARDTISAGLSAKF